MNRSAFFCALMASVMLTLFTSNGVEGQEGIGHVLARQDQEISAPMDATVRQVFVRANQVVAAGELLLVLHSPELELRNLDAKHDVHRLQLALGGLDIRNRQDGTTKQERTELLLEVKETRSLLEAASDRLRQLQSLQSTLQIMAPFDGIVQSVKVQSGDRVKSFDQTLVRVAGREREVTAIFSAAAWLKKYGDKWSQVDGIRFQVTMPHKRIEGIGEETTAFIDPRSQTIKVKIRIPESEQATIPIGLRVTIRVSGDSPTE